MKYSTLPRYLALPYLGAVCALAIVMAGCSQSPAPATNASAPEAAPAAEASAAPPAEPVAAEARAAVEPAEPAPKPAARKRTAARPSQHHVAASSQGNVTANNAYPEPTAAPVRQPITVCTSCGVITAITPVKTEGKGTAIGVVAGGLAGLIVGNQIGGGNGKTIAKVAGAAGGAYVGNKIEKKVRAETSFELKIRLDDGSETTVTQEQEPKLAVGDAVRIVDGAVVAK